MLFQESNQLQLVEKRPKRERTASQVYELSLQAEWQLLRHYSAGDFGHRYLWPMMEPGSRIHFGVDAASNVAQ